MSDATRGAYDERMRARSLFTLFSIVILGCGSSSSDQPTASGDSSTPNDASLGDSATDANPNDSTTPNDSSAPIDAQWDALPPAPEQPALWYWHHSYLSGTAPGEPAKSEALIDQAVAAGYTGIAFWDSSLQAVQRPGWDATKLKAVVDYAVSKGLAVLPSAAPFGYSDPILHDDPNLAEGKRVIGAQFKVSSGKLVFQNSLPPLVNGDFESGTSGWFSLGDPRVSRDTSQHHGGSASAHLAGATGSSDNARLMEKVTVQPWRLYHLRLWLKSANLAKNHPTINIFDLVAAGNPSRYYQDLSFTGTNDWTQIDVTLHSAESTTLGVYIGMWGGNTGDLWVDDVSMEETALVNVVRRDGAPLKVYDATTTYAEGVDFDPIADPNLANFDVYHTPPVPTVKAGGKLAEGAVVSIDHYTFVPIYGFEVGSCLTEPAVQTWEQKNVAALDALFPKSADFFFQYDEMRQMHSCEKCRAQAATAGELLAWHVGLTTDAFHSVRPNAAVYVWNDMFDPNHNAHDQYFEVEDDIAGSWNGLRPGTIIMNWLRSHDSLTFFSGADPRLPHGFQQILAGYYDSGDGASSANADLAAAKGVPGVIGAMYTTWEDDYSQLKAYADTIKAGWADYRASTK